MSTLTQREIAPARRVEYVTPRVNLHQDGDGYTLEVEVPGVAKDGVEVTVDDGKLIITGHRKAAESLGKAVYSERSAADYRRVFDLDPSIDGSKVSAHLDQGLLTLRLQKAEAAKPRRVTVS